MGRTRVLFVDDTESRLKMLRHILAEAPALADIRWRACASAVTDEDLAWAEVEQPA